MQRPGFASEIYGHLT